MESLYHFKKTYYLTKKLGEGAYGIACLAIESVIADRIYAQYCQSDKQTLFAKLRSAMVVVKFHNGPHDLGDEINILTQCLPRNHPRIIEALAHHKDGPT